MGTLLLYFQAASASGRGFACKLMGCGDPLKDYQLVLEVTDGKESSYMAKFSMAEITKELQESVGACPPGDIVLEWMQRAFDGEVVEAAVPAGPGSNSDEQHVATLQVVAPNVHTDAFGNVFTIRLPPQGPMAQLPRPRAAWVAQDLLFSQSERLRAVQRKLQPGEERCPPAQQMEDALAFLASATDGGGAGGSDGGAAFSPAVPRVAQHKRKEREQPAPVSGSAVKAARPAEGAAAAAAAPAPPGQQPAGSQLTGGMSGATQRTGTSSHVIAGAAERSTRAVQLGPGGRPRPPAGRGRGRGRK